MSTIVFDAQAMNETASFLRQKSAEYTEIYRQLLNLANTMGAAWNTPDNLAFVNQINGCCDDLQAMAEQLIVDASVIEAQAKTYVDVSAANQRGAASLAN